MFGLFYIIINGIGSLGHYYRQSFDESNRKEAARNSYDRTYFDKRGRRILLDNNRWVTSDIVDGDRVLRDVKTKKIYRNFSKEQREERENIEKEKAIIEGKTVYLLYLSREVSKNHPWKGDRYKDVSSGRVYVKRRVIINTKHMDECMFYVDILTGRYVRKTDEQIKSDQKWIDELNNLYNEVSKREKRYKKNKDLSEEQLKEIINKKVERERNIINSRFINEDKIEDFIKELNEKQVIYEQNNDSLYYGLEVF